MRMFSTATPSIPAVAWARSDAEFEDLRHYAEAFELDIIRTCDRAPNPPRGAPDDMDEGLALALEDIKKQHAEVVLVHDEPDERNLRRLVALDDIVRAAGGELHTRLGPFACFSGPVSPYVRRGLLEMRRLRIEEKVIKLGREAWIDRMQAFDGRATYGYAFAADPARLAEQKLDLAKRGCEHVFCDHPSAGSAGSRPELRRLAHIAADGDTVRVVDAERFGRSATALMAFIEALGDKQVTVVDAAEQVIWPLPKDVLAKLHPIAGPSYRLSA